MDYVEQTIIRLAFIKMTLKEEYPILSNKEIDNILSSLFMEEEYKEKKIDFLKVLENARKLCALSVPMEIKNYKGTSKRINIIKPEDENIITFKNAFKKLEEEEQRVILESLIFIKNEDAYINAVNKLTNILKEEDEYVSNLVEKTLRKKIVNK